jgi:hypothetical protein
MRPNLSSETHPVYLLFRFRCPQVYFILRQLSTLRTIRVALRRKSAPTFPCYFWKPADQSDSSMAYLSVNGILCWMLRQQTHYFALQIINKRVQVVPVCVTKKYSKNRVRALLILYLDTRWRRAQAALPPGKWPKYPFQKKAGVGHKAGLNVL